MRRLLLVLTIGGCAHSAAVSPSTLAQINWSGPAPRVGLQLAGPGAGDGQHECEAAALRAGVIVDGSAPMTAIVTMADQATRFELLSSKKGVVKTEPHPLSPVGQLCAQAAVAAASAMRDEAAGSPFDSQTSFAVQPAKPIDIHAPVRKEVGPASSSQDSGDPGSGPIQ